MNRFGGREIEITEDRCQFFVAIDGKPLERVGSEKLIPSQRLARFSSKRNAQRAAIAAIARDIRGFLI